MFDKYLFTIYYVSLLMNIHVILACLNFSFQSASSQQKNIGEGILGMVGVGHVSQEVYCHRKYTSWSR
jgi:hypothetical protein